MYLSVLNLCYVIDITLLFFTNSLRLSISVLFFSKWFILFLVWAASKQFLKCWNLRFLFMTHFFVFFFCFLSSSLLSFRQLYAFALNPKNYLMIFPPNPSFISWITFSVFTLGNGLSISKFEVPNLVSTS